MDKSVLTLTQAVLERFIAHDKGEMDLRDTAATVRELLEIVEQQRVALERVASRYLIGQMNSEVARETLASTQARLKVLVGVGE